MIHRPRAAGAQDARHHQSHHHRRRRAADAPAPPVPANALVVVELQLAGGRVVTIGGDAQALADRRLTAAEKQAVRNTVRAVQYLRTRFGQAGYDDAGHAVHLLLGAADADTRGPYAQDGRITAGSRNPLSDAGDRSALAREILPYDVVLHELTHVLQFGVLGSQWERLNSQLTEGIADSLSMLSTRDWSIGEGYFARGRNGQPTGTIRNLDPARRLKGEPLVTDWRTVRDGKVEEHAAGAVVSRTMYLIAQRLGWDRAQQLLWTVIKDREAWLNGGSWERFAEALQRDAQQIWPGDGAAQAVVGAAMAATHLDEAIPARAVPQRLAPLATLA